MKNIVLKILIIILCFYNYNISKAGTIDPNVSDTKYKDYGTEHGCVLKLVGFNINGETSYWGSCVMIDDYHFLTAAHVVSESMMNFVLNEGVAYETEKIIVHKNFIANNFNSDDIAIGRLIKPIKLDYYPELYSGEQEVGKISSQAGYGFTGDFNKGYTKKDFDFCKRAGTNIIVEIDNNLLICKNNDTPKTSLEFLITPGDSGGGLFIEKKLAGIHSCVYAIDKKTDSNYGDTSGHVRISNYIQWIYNTKKQLLYLKEYRSSQ
jgi:hypothetical protein